MKFRYREMIYRPDFYCFDNSDRTEWFPNGIFHYNVSRMISDLQKHTETADDRKAFLNTVISAPVSVEEAIRYNYGVDGLEEKHVDAADLNRPLIFVELAPDCFNLADGNHRLAKAQKKQIKTLSAYFLTAHTAIRYLGSEDEYSHFVEYWNSKIEDIWDQEKYQGLFAPSPAPLLERDLTVPHIWNRMAVCLNECRRVELYSEGEWFTLFRLNGRILCGESETHGPSIKCAIPFEITEDMFEKAARWFEAWQGISATEKERNDTRKEIRRNVRRAKVIMACIRIFSEY